MISDLHNYSLLNRTKNNYNFKPSLGWPKKSVSLSYLFYRFFVSANFFLNTVEIWKNLFKVLFKLNFNLYANRKFFYRHKKYFYKKNKKINNNNNK